MGPAGPRCSSPSASASPSLVLPYATDFLLSFTDDVFVANIAAGPYFDFVTTMFLAFGLVMEFPILLYGLARAGHPLVGPPAGVAPLRDPGHRDLRRHRHAGRRPRQPDRPGRHDVPAVRGDRLRHPTHRPVSEADGAAGPRIGRAADRRAADGPGGRHPQRPVRRRQDRGRQAVRGPRLHRRRQPAGRAAGRTRRARVVGPRALRQGRHRPRRPGRRRARSPWRRCAVRSRAGASRRGSCSSRPATTC